jgi:hypothetical protein
VLCAFSIINNSSEFSSTAFFGLWQLIIDDDYDDDDFELRFDFE